MVTNSRKKNTCKKKKMGGFVLLTIVIIAAATLILASSAAMLSLGGLDMGYTSQKGSEAFSAADGCMEEALGRLRKDSGYSGESLNLGGGSCTITVSGAGSNKAVTSTGSVDDYTRRIETTLTISGDNDDVVTINSWEEK